MIGTVLCLLYNLAFVLLLAPLFAGLTRKLRARLQGRVGPPIRQPYYDLLKLLGKTGNQVRPDYVHRLAPYLTLTGALAAGLFVPLGPRAPLGFAGDGLVLIYLLTLSSIGVVLSGLSSQSPFAAAGASREMMLLLVVEPVLAASFLTVGVRLHSLGLSEVGDGLAGAGVAPSFLLAAVAFFLAVQAESAKLPFDIAEAETELMGGPLIEYAGSALAAAQWALMVRQMVLAAFFSALFLPWPAHLPWLAVLLTPLKMLGLLVVVEVVAVFSPRLRINQAIRFYEGVAVLACTGLLCAAIGA
ncbi:MAG: respiratory chain complex I subunit 1 family protein [Mycobacterium leprae]